MDDRNRPQTSSCGQAIAFGLVVAAQTVFSSLAVERWGMIAFVLILAAMVAASFGLVAPGWARHKGERTSMLLVLVIAITTSEMAQVLGMSLWGSLLINTIIVLAGWLVISRGLPYWQSWRGDSRR